MNMSGFGMIEAIVAAALFSLVAAGVTSTLVLARRVQIDIAADRRATQLAAACLERMRAGGSPTTTTKEDLTIVETLQTWNAHPQLLDARVRVSWGTNGAHSVELRTLLRR